MDSSRSTRLPRRLRDFPDEGMVVIANPANESAAWAVAEREDVGYYLSSIVPFGGGQVYLMDVDMCFPWRYSDV